MKAHTKRVIGGVIISIVAAAALLMLLGAIFVQMVEDIGFMYAVYVSAGSVTFVALLYLGIYLVNVEDDSDE